MSHFAKVENGIVTNVIVADQSFVDVQEGIWVQTSYNTAGGKHYDQDGNEDAGTALRKNYAGVGYTYDSTRDAFYSPEPYPSWTLNDTTCIWESPVAYPSDGKMYSWNEETIAWDLVEE
tara:strand:+ start:171 stop:527 length:357 start_codon:yes stop_codon:yes gene_type:complete